MKITDFQRLEELAKSQGSALTHADLVTYFQSDRESSLASRIAPLLREGHLTRIRKGWYAWKGAKPQEVVRRFVPDASLSLGSALAKHLLIGTVPRFQVRFVSPSSRGMTLEWEGLRAIVHHIHPDLHFGFETGPDGTRINSPEKAVLDTLYYHQKGIGLSFDPETDIDRAGLRREVFLEHVGRYKDSRFQARCRRWLDAL